MELVDGVALVRWPAEQVRLDRLRGAAHPRLLLVAPGAAPPLHGDVLEDWMRLPGESGELVARMRRLASFRAGSATVQSRGSTAHLTAGGPR